MVVGGCDMMLGLSTEESTRQRSDPTFSSSCYGGKLSEYGIIVS